MGEYCRLDSLPRVKENAVWQGSTPGSGRCRDFASMRRSAGLSDGFNLDLITAGGRSIGR